MSETSNISQIADLVSTSIFEEFFWHRTGPVNTNWSCTLLEAHGKKTHPSDVVFYYDDPYVSRRIYVNCDLKSYARGSINKASIGGALWSLSKTAECAQISSEWQDLYLHRSCTPLVVGLLFIYNHDGAYDADFRKLMFSVDPSNYELRANNRMFVLGPREICYLYTMVSDIKIQRGNNTLPAREKCSFFYPDLVRRKALAPCGHPATLEMITGPFQPLKYRMNDQSESLLLYYRRSGESIDEFLYVIDYLFHYQLLQTCKSVELRLPNPSRVAVVNFHKAKEEYIRNSKAEAEIKARLDNVGISTVPTIITSFSEIELGMRNG